MRHLDELILLLEDSLSDSEGGESSSIISRGYNSEIDKLLDFIDSSDVWLREYEEKIQIELGSRKIKIKKTQNQGYCIEASKNTITQIPEGFKHKQTLTHSIRFVSGELESFSNKLDSIEYDLRILENQVLEELYKKILRGEKELQKGISNIVFLDFYTNGTNHILNSRYSLPEVQQSIDVSIKQGRHPVVEKVSSEFISNNLSMTSRVKTHLISGPNMGGKSTFLRQNAIIFLMSHMGYPVPASEAKIPITDGVFSRVGSQDNMYLGQSTFMVEMQEISYILHHATKKSFVIIDEIGRGTSTYDGLSLAQAILFYITKNIGSKMLFATHYHELVGIAGHNKSMANFSLAVGENSENLIFLRKLVPGGILKSYGIEVAKISGMPKQVLEDAKSILESFQTKSLQTQLFSGEESVTQKENKYFDPGDENIINTLSELDIDNITPMRSLQILSDLKKQVKKRK